MPPVIPNPEPTPVIYSHPLYLADLRGVLYVLYLSSSGISDAGSDASNVSQSPAAQMGLGGAWRPLPAGGCGSEHPTCNPPRDGGGSPGSYTAQPRKGVLPGEAAGSARTFGEWAVSRETYGPSWPAVHLGAPLDRPSASASTRTWPSRRCCMRWPGGALCRSSRQWSDAQALAGSSGTRTISFQLFTSQFSRVKEWLPSTGKETAKEINNLQGKWMFQ